MMMMMMMMMMICVATSRLHKTNDWVRIKVNLIVGSQKPLLATVKRRKLAWFRHVTRLNSLSKTILQRTLEDGRCHGQLRKCLSSPTWSTRPTTGCGAGSASLRVHRNLFWQLSRDGNLHGSGMSHAPTASPKPSVRAPWSVVGRRRGRRGKCWMDNIKRLE